MCTGIYVLTIHPKNDPRGPQYGHPKLYIMNNGLHDHSQPVPPLAPASRVVSRRFEGTGEVLVFDLRRDVLAPLSVNFALLAQAKGTDAVPASSRDTGRIDPHFKPTATLVTLKNGFVQWRGEDS